VHGLRGITAGDGDGYSSPLRRRFGFDHFGRLTMWNDLYRWITGQPQPLLTRVNESTVKIDIEAYRRLKQLRLQYIQHDDQISAIIEEATILLDYDQPTASAAAAVLDVLDAGQDFDAAMQAYCDRIIEEESC
jgi:hypothetical protein